MVWPLRFGATVRNEFHVGELATRYAISSFSSDIESEMPFTAGGPVRSYPLTLSPLFTSDGPVEGPYPGYPFVLNDVIGPLNFVFELGLTDIGSFIFASDFAGAPEAAISDGGRGPFQGMAYQDPTDVAIEGGTIRNVTFTGITIDGGNF